MSKEFCSVGWKVKQAVTGLWFWIMPIRSRTFFPDQGGDSETPKLSGYMPRTPRGIIIITTRDIEVAQQLAGPRNVFLTKKMEFAHAEALLKTSISPAVCNTINLAADSYYRNSSIYHLQ
jgi:hypothetical protein